MQAGVATASDSQSQADELEERLIDFAVRIIKLSARLPKTPAGKHIASQILRSGTSPAPNYGEAGGAESSADFVHKLRIVLKELNENTNGLIRQYFPKKFDFAKISPEEVQHVAARLNNRPRKTLGFRTPNEVFFKHQLVALPN